MANKVQRFVLTTDANGVTLSNLNQQDAVYAYRKVTDLWGRCTQGAANSNMQVADNAAYATDVISGVNPSNNDTITLGNVVITFKTSGATGNQVNIGASLAATMVNLQAFINNPAGPLAGIMNMSVSAGNATSGSIDLGAAAGYALLAASTITNTGASVINGNLGLSPGTSVTGFPPGVVSGVKNIANSAAANAQSSALSAYNLCKTLGQAGTTLTGSLDSNSPLAAGNYNYASSGGLTSALTISGSASSKCIVYCGSTFITGSSAVVTLTGGILPQNVFFVAGSSATLGGGTVLPGNVIALASISLSGAAGTTVTGQLMALTAAITISAADTVSANGSLAGTVNLLTADVPGLIGNGLQASASALTVGTFNGGLDGVDQTFSIGL